MMKKEALKRVIEKRQRRINQPITIRDVLIRYSSSRQSKGEFSIDVSEGAENNALSRLQKHLEYLARYTCSIHQQTSEGEKNHITRLLMNEFGLFTKKPLSMKAFVTLCLHIQTVAKSLASNVHLMLSSLAVQLEDGKVLNTVLYVECGTDSHLHTIVKRLDSFNDCAYEEASFVQIDRHNDLGPDYSIADILANPKAFTASEQGVVVSNNSLLRLSTSGGAEFILGIDICIDHVHANSKRLLMKGLGQQDALGLIPSQVSHVVTSNTISIKSGNALTDTVAHIDPRQDYFQKSDFNYQALLDELQHINISSVDETPVIEAGDGSLKITNLPFGSDIYLEVGEAYSLGGLTEEITKELKTASEPNQEEDTGFSPK